MLTDIAYTMLFVFNQSASGSYLNHWFSF